jgi:Protein of unknown function DUF262/Protein of unknown function (DUF1524)
MVSGLAQISVGQETIGHALKDHALFVPIHQRSYAWETEHVTDLYQDLARAIDEGDSEYFLGAIVVVKSSGDKLEINDGQQRMATSTILIAAIRDYFLHNSDEKTAAIIENNHLFSTDRRTHEVLAKLHLNAEDHDYFQNRILSRADDSKRQAAEKATPTKESHKRINKAAELAATHVKRTVAALRDKDKAAHLHKWLDFLDEGARVIWVQVADGRTAYVIFETMNDRGLKLSAADLLKNYLIGMADDRQMEVFQKWQSMSAIVETLGEQEDAIVNYVRYSWISQKGPIRSRDLYDSIKAKVKNKTAAVSLSAELDDKSKDYAALLTPSHEKWATYAPSVRKQIETLSFLGVKQTRPILMAAFEKFSKSEFQKLLRAIVSWSVRYILSGITPGALENPHGRSAMKIFQGEITTVKKLLTEMAGVIPDDARFEGAVATANVSQQRLARYYLRALQQGEDGKAEPYYVPSEELTLEHILPQNPGSDWGYIPPITAKELLNRLGNQVLLPPTVNSGLGNVGYSTKKLALATAEFSLTKEAATATKWDAEAITKRQQRLASLAIKTWPLNPT